jgi:hypothetical protein
VVPLGNVRKCRTSLKNTVPNRRGIHELIKKVWSTGSLLDKKAARNGYVLMKEKLNEIGARLEFTTDITAIPSTRDCHVEIVSNLSYKAS